MEEQVNVAMKATNRDVIIVITEIKLKVCYARVCYC